jgi:hypothetical protein
MRLSFFEDLVRCCCQGEGFGAAVVIGDLALDRVFEVGDGLEDAAPESEAFAVAHESGIGIG